MVERIWLMSAYASVLILIVLVARHVLRQYSKVYCYSLWILVIVRLVCPIFLTSNRTMHTYVQDTITKSEVWQQQSNEWNLQEQKQSSQPLEAARETSHFDSASIIEMLKVVWMLGVVAAAAVFFIQYISLKKKLQTAIKDEDTVWLCDRIDSPFVFGLCRPRIYLPYGMSGAEREYIIKHETTHIKHKDAWIRAIGTVAVCLHWWNPMVWYCIHKVNQDMEMFCDETVLRGATNEERKAYARILLMHSIKRSGMTLAMAFGETNTEKRIKHISRGKSRKYAITIITTILTVMLAVCFGTIPKEKVEGSSAEESVFNKELTFSGGDEQFLETVCSSPEEAKAYVTKFATAVSKGQKEVVANMMAYPRKLDTGSEVIEIQNEQDFIKYYDVLFTSKFKDDLGKWLEEDINYNYLGMYLSDGSVWFLLGENGWFLNSVVNPEGTSIYFDF